jgi:hypothetical protein
MERNKLLKIVLIIGIGLIIAGPVVGIALNKINLVNRKPYTGLTETSDDELQSAFYKHFTLTKNQKVVIKFSVFYPNVTARLKIFNRHFFDAEFDANSDPTGLIGENFIYTVHVLGTTPSLSTGTSVSITEQGEVYIEFAGDRSGFNLISLPGRYTVVVYGVNSGTSEDVIFNIVVNVDGPGAFLGGLFLTVGIVVLICYALLISYNYLNNLRRGR